jgi:hypothetical protein
MSLASLAGGLTCDHECSFFVLLELKQSKGHYAMLDSYLRFKVVRTKGREEIVARTNNLLVGRAAFETARRLYPNERVDYRDGARIIAHSEPVGPSPEAVSD